MATKETDPAAVFWNETEEETQARLEQEARDFWKPNPVCKECGKDFILSTDHRFSEECEGDGVCMICKIK